MKQVFFVAVFIFVSMGMNDSLVMAPAQFQGGKQGLVNMLAYVRNMSIEDRVAFSRMLEPSKRDCEAIFESGIAASMYRWERKLYRRFNPVVTPISRTQTELACWESTRNELMAYEGEARFFPGGYREMAPHIRPGVEIYRIKFLEPGRNIGAAYDMFVYINGHWVLLWQPWRLLLQ